MKRRWQGALTAVICFLTVSVAIWSWGSFVSDAGAYRGPVIVIGAVVLVLGVLVRAVLPRWVAPPVQLVAGLAIASQHLTGAPAPVTPGASGRLSALIDAASTTFVHAFPPVPAQDIAVVLVPGGMLAYVAVDALAVTIRRPGLAGLVLLVVLAAAMGAAGNGGHGVPWPVFVLTTAGFLVLLALQEAGRARRWGRPLDTGASGLGTPAQRGPVLVGVTATALALVVPLAVPTLHLDFGGWGEGNHGPITVTNPMVGMYGDLTQDSSAALVHVSVLSGAADDPAPTYLKIATLNQFDGSEWSTVTSANLAHTTTYELSATAGFESHWLPVFDFPVTVRADGDWRYDTTTYDFIAADKSLSTAGLSWTESAAPVDPSQKALEGADFGDGAPAVDTQLPADLSPKIYDLAQRVAGSQPTPFLEGVALQDWFTKTGGFRYSTKARGGDSSSDLLSFVTTNKVGYCQQFATAFAAMARALGIPARVDVGFLRSHPDTTGNGYVFEGGDMHAWPELWIAGSGWVRFEPTPGNGAAVPAYTQGVKLAPTPGNDGQGDSTTTPPPNSKGQGAPLKVKPQPNPDATPVAPTAATHHSLTWLWVLIGVVVAGALATLPWWVRRRRRAHRLAGDPEDLWAELADTARDLQLPWAEDDSPRRQGTVLARYVDSDSRGSLDRVVLAVERSRYARPGAAESVREDAEAVISGLESRVSPGAARAAAVLPRSVLGVRSGGRAHDGRSGATRRGAAGDELR